MKYVITILLSAFALTLISFTLVEGYKIGDKATDFSLKNVDGTFVSLSDYENANGYIVIFTCNTCPYSKMYEDRIQELHEKYAHAGYPVVAINPNDPKISRGDSFNKMKERAATKGFEFPYLFDAGQVVFPQYGATRTPHVYVLDDELIVRYIGTIDDNPQNAGSVSINYIDAAVKALEMGKDPNPATTKAIGCSIKVSRA